ncbi:PEX11 domain protein [Aspergillus sclerotialis]|uniref:PEX11 domain protein n=1 Tax=Aspergillus sclerotialis TaxID=2070753 RepID=A0A3A2ZHZ6_9EURO|nr:PEX11 domain protein [Aspergillus sclerotialis]
MTYLRSARPRVSLLKKFTNFTNSSAGLEKTLRLIHALALVAAEICVDNVTITRCLIAQSQIALGEYNVFLDIEMFHCILRCMNDSLVVDNNN